MLFIMRSYMHTCHFIWLNNLCFFLYTAKVVKIEIDENFLYFYNLPLSFHSP